MSELWLTPDEVVELTAKKRWSAQCRALSRMGVEFTPNDVGRPLVVRSRYEQSAASRQRKKQEPDWSAIRGKAA